MKSALEIVAYANATETEGTIALLEVAIAALTRSGYPRCAELADFALHEFVEESIKRMTGEPSILAGTRH